MPTIQKIRGLLQKNGFPMGRTIKGRCCDKFTPNSLEVTYYFDKEDGRVLVSFYYNNPMYHERALNVISRARTLLENEGYKTEIRTIGNDKYEHMFIVR